MNNETITTPALVFGNNIGTLAARLASVLAQVRRVPKSGRNEFHRYDYATEADVLDAVRPHLAAAGIAVASSYRVISTELIDTKRGKDRLVRVELTVLSFDSDGAWIQSTAIGEGTDRGDKAIYKAVTGAFKYWAAKTFLLSSGDDPEGGEEHAPPAPVSRPAPAPAIDVTEAAEAGKAAVLVLVDLTKLDEREARKRLVVELRNAAPAGPYTADQIRLALDEAVRAWQDEAEPPALLTPPKPAAPGDEFDQLLSKIDKLRGDHD